jgi:hypothetical protein
MIKDFFGGGKKRSLSPVDKSERETTRNFMSDSANFVRKLYRSETSVSQVDKWQTGWRGLHISREEDPPS